MNLVLIWTCGSDSIWNTRFFPEYYVFLVKFLDSKQALRITSHSSVAATLKMFCYYVTRLPQWCHWASLDW